MYQYETTAAYTATNEYISTKYRCLYIHSPQYYDFHKTSEKPLEAVRFSNTTFGQNIFLLQDTAHSNDDRLFTIVDGVHIITRRTICIDSISHIVSHCGLQ